MFCRTTSIAIATSLVLAGSAARAGAEFIPDLAEPANLGAQTSFQVRVHEQAKLEVPALVTFDVIDATLPTPQNETSVVRASGIVLEPNHSLLIQIAPASASFIDSGGHATYASTKVSWTQGAVTGGQGTAGALGAVGEYRPLLTCQQGSSCESADLRFVLAPDPTVRIAGTHTLVCLYRASSVL